VNGNAVRRYSVIYDGDCRICARLVARLARLDARGAFDIIPSQHPSVRGRFPWISERAYAESLQLVRNADGRTWQGAAAVEEIIRGLRAGWLLSWIFAIPLVRPIAERLYRWFADHRGELGCADHCKAGGASVASGEER
jgi:predicted DCC family thiol-disulfide oxidoreductase YuxK